MLNELEIKVPYSVKNPHISDGLIKYLQQKLGKKIIKDQEPKSEFQIERERKRTFGESCDYIGKNGYLPQKILGKRHAKINRHYKSLFKADPPPVQKRKIIDPKLEKLIEEQFFEIYRKRQPLLENEYKSLEYMKNKLGFSMDKMTALPMENDTADKAFEMLQKQEMLQKMLGTVDPFSITGIYELNNWERQRGNARRRRNIGDASGGPGPDGGGGPGPDGGGNQPLGVDDDDDGYMDPNEQTFQSLMGKLPVYPSLNGGNGMKDSVEVQPYGSEQAKKGLFGIDIPHPSGGELQVADYYQQVHTRAYIPFSMEKQQLALPQQQEEEKQIVQSRNQNQTISNQEQVEQIDTSVQAQAQRQQNAGFSLSTMIASGVSKVKNMITVQVQRAQQNQEMIQPKNMPIQNIINEKQDPINDANNNAVAGITNVNRGVVVDSQKAIQQSTQQAFGAIAQQNLVPLVAAQKMDETIPFTDNDIAGKAAEQQMQDTQQQQQPPEQQQQLVSMEQQIQQEEQKKKEEEDKRYKLQMELLYEKSRLEKQKSITNQQEFLAKNFNPLDFKEYTSDEILGNQGMEFSLLRMTNLLFDEANIKMTQSEALTGQNIEERMEMLLMDEADFLLKSNKGKQFLEFYSNFIQQQNQLDHDIIFSPQEQKAQLQAKKKELTQTLGIIYKQLISQPRFLEEALNDDLKDRPLYKFNIQKPIRSIKPSMEQVQEQQPQPQPQPQVVQQPQLAIEEQPKQPVIQVSDDDSVIVTKTTKAKKTTKKKLPAKQFEEEKHDYDIKGTIKEAVKLIDNYVTSSESDKNVDDIAAQIMKLSPNQKIASLEKQSVKKVRQTMSNLRTTLTAFDNAFDQMTTQDVDGGKWSDRMKQAVKASAAYALQSGKPIGQFKKEIEDKGRYLKELTDWIEGNAKTTPETYYEDLTNWIQNAFSEKNLGQNMSKQDILSATKALFKSVKKYEIIDQLNKTGVQQKILSKVPQEYYKVGEQDAEISRKEIGGTHRQVFQDIEQDISSTDKQAKAFLRKKQKAFTKKQAKKGKK